MKVSIWDNEWYPVYEIHEDAEGIDVPDALVTRLEKAKTAFRKAQGSLAPYRDEQAEVERRKQAQGEVQRTVERVKDQLKDLPEDAVRKLLEDAVK